MRFNTKLIKSKIIACKLYIPFALLIFSISGCGDTQDKQKLFSELIPAKGKITLNGEPLGAASVTFSPEEGQTGLRMASALTDNTGSYELTTPIANTSPEDSKGIAPGKYRVIISRYVMPDGSALPPGTTEADAMAEGAKESVPAKYSNFEKSSLSVEVEKITDPNMTYDFDLETK